MRKIGQLSGTAYPHGHMRSILGSQTRERAIDEWRQYHAEITTARLKSLVAGGVISKSQYRKVSKAILSGLHEQPKTEKSV